MVAPRARALLLVAPLGLAALAAGCSSPRGDASGPPVDGVEAAAPGAGGAGGRDVESIAMVGDSITRGSEVALRAAFDDLGVEVAAIDGADGRRMTVEGYVSSGRQAVEAVDQAHDPDLWVVALGTNDVAQYASDEDYRTAIDAVLDELPADDEPLVWVDVFLDGSEGRCEDFNRVLREALDDRGNATIVDWSLLAGQDGMLVDGIHPGSIGIEVFADLVAGGVGRWLG